MRYSLFLMAALLAAGPAVAAEETAPQDLPPRPVVSEIVSLHSGLPSAWVGTVAAPREIDLGFPQIGTVVERIARLGDVVEAGQILARQDPGELEAAVRSAQAGVSVAEVQLRSAQDARDRTAELVSRGVDSTATLESRDNALAAAEATLEQARATLARAEDARDYADLAAPQDGVITAVLAEAGATLSAGEPLFSLASVEDREVLVDFSESDATALQPGTPFDIVLEVNPAIRSGAVLSSLDALATRSTRTRTGHLTLDSGAPDAFRLGALVVARLAQETRSVVTVPVSALIRGAEPPAVWVIASEARTLDRVGIETGPSAGGRVVVTGGLDVGDEVLTKGVNSVEQGQVVGARMSE